MFDEFFGVPMHPFAIHAPIVLLPIVAIVAVVLTARVDWRHRIGWGMPVAVLVLAAMLFVAKESGEAARDAQNVFGDITQHQDLGTQTLIITVVWFVLALGLVVRDRQMAAHDACDLSSAAAAPARDPIALGLSLAVAVVAIVATIWLIRTGHAGAESRWDIG